jgi:hypothetical protein
MEFDHESFTCYQLKLVGENMCGLALTSVDVFVVVSGLDERKQRFISRMIGLANPPYTPRATLQTGTSSTATPSVSTPGSARVSANITTTTSASVGVNTQQRSNEHGSALMAALQSQPVQPPSPSHKTSVLNRSFYNFHSSSFYNKPSASTSAKEDAVVDVPTAHCVSVVNKEEFHHAVVHLMKAWAHTYLARTRPTTTNTYRLSHGFLNFAMPECITIPHVLLRARTQRELAALVSERVRVSINCQFPRLETA